jgi:hypothetical protein
MIYGWGGEIPLAAAPGEVLVSARSLDPGGAKTNTLLLLLFILFLLGRQNRQLYSPYLPVDLFRPSFFSHHG